MNERTSSKRPSGYDRVPQGVSVNAAREEMRILSCIVLVMAIAIGVLMGLVTYWIG